MSVPEFLAAREGQIWTAEDTEWMLNCIRLVVVAHREVTAMRIHEAQDSVDRSKP